MPHDINPYSDPPVIQRLMVILRTGQSLTDADLELAIAMLQGEAIIRAAQAASGTSASEDRT